jgi:anti-sigma regulatory factor (Ser/Thr protein kinase)
MNGMRASSVSGTGGSPQAAGGLGIGSLPPWFPLGSPGSREVTSHRGDFGMSRATPFMARGVARLVLAEWEIAPEAADVAILLVSELVANAVLFATERRAGDWRVPHVSLALWRLPGQVVLEVSDENEKPPEIRVPEPDAEGGRGLLLVQALSREWSYYFPRPGWKTVYCVIETG